jgi:hypothetical protein
VFCNFVFQNESMIDWLKDRAEELVHLKTDDPETFGENKN